ncbi:MAG: DnaA regulatory inactivator Hda [Proteobacteria bacterium]|nr:DnaA regulatory inactivator Hda [Pseudomonadota bacterium]NOG60133.1 DnaA regulatory inactivator Hda [Pseudomonadota bacterium]
MPSDSLPHSPSPQIPFQFGDFQKNDLASFLAGENKDLLKLVNLITSKEKNHSLYLWGESGTGKSHLLQAACKQAAENKLHVAYIPLKQLSELSAEMLHDLGELDLVCVDDIEYVAGQIEWQQGLTWLYNELRDNNHSMIISSNKSPTNINLEVEDLKSRLGWDQAAQIKSPGDDVKIQILKQKANARSFELSDDVIEFLIRRVERDMGSLIEVLDKIDHASLAAKRKITIPFVKELINT